MKLKFGLVAGTDVRTPGGILQMKREQALRAARREVFDGAKSQAVKPRFKRKAFRLLASIAQCTGNGFIDDFFFRDRVRSDLVGHLPEKEFALDETFQPAQTGIYISADVIGRSGRDADCGNRV